ASIGTYVLTAGPPPSAAFPLPARAKCLLTVGPCPPPSEGPSLMVAADGAKLPPRQLVWSPTATSLGCAFAASSLYRRCQSASQSSCVANGRFSTTLDIGAPNRCGKLGEKPPRPPRPP